MYPVLSTQQMTKQKLSAGFFIVAILVGLWGITDPPIRGGVYQY